VWVVFSVTCVVGLGKFFVGLVTGVIGNPNCWTSNWCDGTHAVSCLMRRGLGWHHTTRSVIAANSFVTMHYTSHSTYAPSLSVVTPLLIVVIIRTSRWSTSDTRETDTAARHDGLVGCLGRTTHRIASSGGVLMVRSRSAAVGAVMTA